MKKKVGILFRAVLLFLLAPVVCYAVIPLPYRIGGTVTVNGVQITQDTDTGYTFVVTPYTGAGGTIPQDTDGLNASNWYIIDVPTYDAADQPNGAQSGQVAVIRVYKDGSPLDVTLPANNGQFSVGDPGTNGTINIVAIINTPPTADAGPAQTVNEGVLVTLNGSGSSDPESAITYKWTQTGGPGVILSNSTAANPTFMPPNVGPAGAVLTFSLTVTDTGGLKDTDTCTVTVNWVDAPPAANAGPNQTVGEGGVVVTLNGSGSDDIGITSYQWIQTAGAPVVLSNANIANPTFTAPATAPASMTFQLTVTDTGGKTDTDTCTVTVSTAPLLPPIADAGPDQAADEGALVTLDGSGSSDPDGAIEGYEWVQTAGPAVTLSDPAAVNPTFTAPDSGPVSLTFQLTVTDNDVQTDTDTCTINVGMPPDFEVETTLLFPYLASNATYWRGIAIVNPNASNGTINLTLHDTAGETATATVFVNAGNTFVNLLENISWAGNADVDGRCYITADMDFTDGRGFAMFGDNTGNSMGYVVENNAEATAPTNLFFPYFASNATYWRGIAIVNPSQTNGTINLTLHDMSGKTATATVYLNAGRLFVQMVEAINWKGTADVNGRCYITATMNFAGGQGFAMFGDSHGNSLGYVVN